MERDEENAGLNASELVDDAIEIGKGQPKGAALVPLDRAAFIARAKDYRENPTVERVELPWLNTAAYVRGMSAFERDAFESSLVERGDDGSADQINAENIRAKFLVRVLCDANGTRLFGDAEHELIETLDARTADRLFAAARRLSGMTKADVEEIAKNSVRARNGNSSSNSPSKNSAVSPTS